jgi:dUTP pyrophosphatase
VEVKKLKPEAIIPTRAHKDIPDAGWDLHVTENKRIPGLGKAVIGTGLAMSIPKGWYGNIRNRSGTAINTPLMVDAGVVDPGYRGEIKLVVVNTSEYPYDVVKGTKIAQLLFELVPDVELIEVVELDTSDRGEKGFGSTGS